MIKNIWQCGYPLCSLASNMHRSHHLASSIGQIISDMTYPLL